MFEIPLENFTFGGWRPTLKFPSLPGGRKVESAEDYKEWNRIHLDLRLLESIRKAGRCTEPILVWLNKSDKKYVIVVGYGRYFVYEKLNEEYPDEGWNKIPAKIAFEDALNESREPTQNELYECRSKSQLAVENKNKHKQ